RRPRPPPGRRGGDRRPVHPAHRPRRSRALPRPRRDRGRPAHDRAREPRRGGRARRALRPRVDRARRTPSLVTRAEKADRIKKTLAKLYPLPPIPLQHDDPYTLLLAVVLSAQCTDVRVNQVTPRLFARARTPVAMAQIATRDIEAIIKPCGL